MLLSFRKITKYYNNKKILDSIDLKINSNEIVSIFGPSGSGKTTLLNIIGLIDNQYEGVIEINNNIINSKTKTHLIRRQDLGFIFQFHHLLPEFNIFENLLLALYFSNLTKEKKNEKIITYLEYLKIGNLINKYPHQISGGERQRVSIIRSIIHDPLLVCADEPTGNLDEKNSEIVLNLINDLKLKSSISFIIATHDKKTIKISDRVLNLENKKLKIDR